MFRHRPVLLRETIAGLNIKPDGTYVDATLGGAGHSQRIASQLSDDGRLIGIDQDEAALDAARQRLAGALCRVELVKANFRHLSDVLDDLQLKTVDGVLFDVGVSSFQLETAERGFSYHTEAVLDMRMDLNNPLTAYKVVNEWDGNEIARILRRYGEEKYARNIASAITRYRAKKTIETTTELAGIVKSAIPAAARRRGPHPARRTFQAIRIAVNDELGALEDGLDAAIERTAVGGRICVITFHSLEDRLVKERFRKGSEGCTCPPDFPVCVCGHRQTLKIVNRKPIIPSEAEVEDNPRARSAKLRIAEKWKEESK